MTQSSMRERAAKVANDDDEDEVEYSCGCVFCDLALVPETRNGQRMHYIEAQGEWIPCTWLGNYRGVW